MREDFKSRKEKTRGRILKDKLARWNFEEERRTKGAEKASQRKFVEQSLGEIIRVTLEHQVKSTMDKEQKSLDYIIRELGNKNSETYKKIKDMVIIKAVRIIKMMDDKARKTEDNGRLINPKNENMKATVERFFGIIVDKYILDHDKSKTVGVMER